LANAGTINGQLANCFVLPFEDNIEEIFEVVRESSILKKNGGGVGFSFSKIRPKGDHIATTTGGACGPVALMKILDSASEILLQAGGRRSGNMIILSVSHPDVLEFITCKEQENVLNQINYSLGVSDKFMKAVEKNKEWELVNPRTGKTEQKISAANIFNFASSSAWRNGDPGMIFLDRINKDNPTPHVGFIEAVNLCGEQPLLPYEACNLGSINLTKFLKNKRQKNADFDFVIEGFDWKHLEEVVRIATRMLDNVISVCRYPVSKVDRVVKANRKIGLGVMGWADALIKMGIPYNSEKAYKLAERLMKFISDISHDESQILGKLKGSFPHFPGSVWQKKGFKHMRNSTCTTIAPTGSISMTAGVSSGIEPVFALLYYKQVMGGIKLPEVNKDLLSGLYKSYKVSRPYNNYNEYQEYVISEIAKCGSIQKIIDVSDKIRKVFVTAMDISYDDHIRMQAAFQKFTDNAVSKTINLPNSATVDDVKKAFFSAWKMGCKGITVYRDKSRNVQVLNIGKTTIDQMTDNFIQAKKNPAFDPTKCPDCGGILVKEEGCMNCPSCGFSACSV
jgi:ribonucleoside-diphosphate reductase alpha chain